MKKYILLLLFFNVLNICDIFSQEVSLKEKNSFYNGKRGLLEIGINPRGSTYSYELPVGSFAFIRNTATKMNPFLEYSYGLTNRWSATINAGRTTHFRRPIGFFGTHESGGSLSEYDFFFIGEIKSKEIQSNKVGLRLNYHLKKKGAISPLGHYFGFGFNYLMNSIDYEDEPLLKFTRENGELIILEKYDGKRPIKFNLWSIDLTYGARKNITENLFVSWHMLWSINNWFGPMWGSESSSDKTYTQNSGDFILDVSEIKKSDLIKPSEDVMRRTNLFSFRFGIGYVIH
jgi:hypothetical protein